MALAYREFGDYQTAARTFEELATHDETEPDKLSYLLRAANQYAQAEQWDRSNEVIEDLKRKVAATPDGQRELLSTLRVLAESEKNDELEVAVTEQMVELNPGDASARFSLAFKHSQIGNNDM